MASEQRAKPQRTPALSKLSWLFPLNGIYYFLAHPFLWPLLRARLLPSALLSLFVLTNLFLWTYLPQVAFLAMFHGRQLALINGAFLVLGEGAAIVQLLFEAFFVDETLVDVFDAVLVNEGHEDILASSRPINPNGKSPVKRLGNPTAPAIYSPFSLRQIVEFIIFLPLNFIPLAGTPIFLILTGYRGGPLHHWRYFKLLGLTKKERKLSVKKRQLQYSCFGTIALLLQLVPVLSMLFLLTTAAGSALWVVSLEDTRKHCNATRLDNDSEEAYVDDPV